MEKCVTQSWPICGVCEQFQESLSFLIKGRERCEEKALFSHLFLSCMDGTCDDMVLGASAVIL